MTLKSLQGKGAKFFKKKEDSQKINEFLSNSEYPIIAHNSSFDLNILKEHVDEKICENILDERRWYCTLELAKEAKRKGNKFIHSFGLSSLLEVFNASDRNSIHDAISDACAVHRLYRTLLDQNQISPI